MVVDMRFAAERETLLRVIQRTLSNDIELVACRLRGLGRDLYSLAARDAAEVEQIVLLFRLIRKIRRIVIVWNNRVIPAAVFARNLFVPIPTLQRIYSPISCLNRSLISRPISITSRSRTSGGASDKSITPSSILFILAIGE